MYLLILCIMLKVTFINAYRLSSNTMKCSSLTSLRMMSHLPSSVVKIKQGKAKLFQGGNPLIYGGAVEDESDAPVAGSEVHVTDTKSNTIGRGFYNPHSQYRVRMLIGADEAYLLRASLQEVLTTRIENAVALRRACGLPSSTTTAYRLINGEGDRLSGLMVDVLGNTIVIQSSAIWCEVHRKLIEASLVEVLGLDVELLWRQQASRLKQDGYNGVIENKSDQPEISSSSSSGSGGGGGGSSSSGDGGSGSDSVDQYSVEVVENGVRYLTNPKDGQKTGFYCDQRDNRMMIRELSEGCSVLDTYCYSGGFGLNAVVGGASSVTMVDSSASAINLAKNNIRVNAMDDSIVDFHTGDAVKVMRELANEGKQYDIVIADPPKFAPTRNTLEKARKKYIQVNEAAMKLVKPGGLLLTHSCSAAVTQQHLLPTFILQASLQAGKRCAILKTSGAGGDHPVHASYPQGSYLSACLVNVQ